MILRIFGEVLERMSKRPREGPSEQLLADWTLSIQEDVSFLASVVQYSLISHALSLVGLVPLMVTVLTLARCLDWCLVA